MAKSARRTFLASTLPALALAAPVSAQQARGASSPAQGKGSTVVRRRTRLRRTVQSCRTATSCSSRVKALAQVSRATSRRRPRVCSIRSRSRSKAAGSSMDKVLKVNVYLSDIKNFEGMNEVYRPRFAVDPPVRTTIGGVFMPDGGLIEIDCIAYI